MFLRKKTKTYPGSNERNASRTNNQKECHRSFLWLILSVALGFFFLPWVYPDMGNAGVFEKFAATDMTQPFSSEETMSQVPQKSQPEIMLLASKEDDDEEDDEKEKKKIRKKIKIRFMEDLNFGKVVSHSQTTAKVVINPQNGDREFYNTYDIDDDSSRGELKITGEPGENFVITLPEEVELTSNNGATFKLSNLAVYPGQTGELGSEGKATVYLGGTLTIEPNTSGLKNKGSINVYVDYQF